MCVKTYLSKGIITGSVGLVLAIAFPLIQWLAVPAITDSILRKFITLQEGEFVWNIWQDPPFPIYTDYYVFNCTNYEQVINEGAVPIVEELGPYSFREFRVKEVTNNQQTTVEYREHREYFFSPSTTNGQLNDVITTANPAYMTISKLLADIPDLGLLGNNALNVVIRKANTFLDEVGQSALMTVPVGQLLFEGWPLDDYIALYREIRDDLANLPFPLPPLPEIPENFTSFSYGIFTNRNNSDDGIFVVDTGINDYRTFAKILSWDNASSLPHWEGGPDSYCNMINGTDGTVFPYDTDVTQPQYIYQTDLCRTVYTVYEKDEISHDLLGRKLILPRSVLANPADDEKNTCFCKNPSDESTCYGTGLVNLGACFAGAPLVGSSPHFFDADPKYNNTVIGLKPDKELHQTHLILEERTNVLLHASKRVQLSVNMQNYRGSGRIGLTSTANLRQSFLPVVWYHERADIDDESARVFFIFTIIDIVLGILTGIGGVLVIVGAVLIGCHYKKEDKKQRV